jgi:nucleotide-binding universal stress UspA family protein
MKILVALDSAPCSRYAAESLANRAWAPQTTFMILSVIEPFQPELAGWNSGFVPVAVEAQKEQLEAAQKLVKETAEHLRSNLTKQSGAESTIMVEELVLEGHVKEMILDTARQWDADLIVMGSHGRHGMEKLVLSDAPCSVEIVKAKT